MNKAEIVEELHVVAKSLERLARQKRNAFDETGHRKWQGMAIAYEQAAIKVRKLAGSAITRKTIGATPPSS